MEPQKDVNQLFLLLSIYNYERTVKSEVRPQ